MQPTILTLAAAMIISPQHAPAQETMKAPVVAKTVATDMEPVIQRTMPTLKPQIKTLRQPVITTIDLEDLLPVIVAPPQEVILPLPTTFLGSYRSYRPPTFEDYIKSQIDEMTKASKLTPRQIRRLRVAGKGVLKRSARVGQFSPRREQMVGGFKLPESAKHRAMLAGSGLWKKTVEKTLTPEQLKQWREHKPVPAVQKLNMDTLPKLPELRTLIEIQSDAKIPAVIVR